MRPGVDTPLGVVRDGLVAVRDGRIAWIGPEVDAPADLLAAPENTFDAGGGWVTPGLIDAHTHLVFGGHRADEFEQRLSGVSYEEIARAGGGILSTVRATRAASASQLLATATERLEALVSHGCTTVEVKSGYGLNVETELRMLEVARDAGAATGATVTGTLLGAHAVPPEFADDRAGYVALVCEEMIPRAAEAGLATAVDAFCEPIAFSREECERVLRTGAEFGLAVRLHADQLTDAGGASLAAELGARSADHLEFTSDEGVRAMAGAGTAAVLLPGAYHYLGSPRKPPVDAFRSAGVPIVVATDLNPGSSPVGSPLLAMHLACVHFGLTPSEALLGMTRHAAHVLDLDDRGFLVEGARADLACWDVSTPAELAYWMGRNPCGALFSAGSRLR